MATLLLRFAGRSEVCTKSLVNKRANGLLQLSRCDIGFLPAIQPAIDDIIKRRLTAMYLLGVWSGLLMMNCTSANLILVTKKERKRGDRWDAIITPEASLCQGVFVYILRHLLPQMLLSFRHLQPYNHQ